MKELIIQKLAEIEQTEGIKILHAVESGSRAWGFPSPDSDYDVRFIYVRNPEFYLKLEKTRDVIELPINDMLDVNGWDLNKTLRLLHSSNPTLFEWMSSPVVYRQTEFIDQLRPIMDNYFSCKSGLYSWVKKHRENGEEGLEDKRGHHKTDEEVDELERLRRENKRLKKQLAERDMLCELLKKVRELEGM